MDNIFALRLLMALVITAATAAVVLAVAFMKFPDNAVIIILSVAVGGVVSFFVQKKVNAALFEIYYRTVQELGMPLSYNGLQAAFERNGTRFDIDFPQGKHNYFFKIIFYLPNIRQKFSVQNKSLATVHHNDCYRIDEKDSPLPTDFLLQSRNPEFLFQFLEIPAIRNEILSYEVSMWSRTAFSFEDGNFEFIWTPSMSEGATGFDRACRTAAAFHDELQKISVKYLKTEEA